MERLQYAGTSGQTTGGVRLLFAKVWPNHVVLTMDQSEYHQLPDGGSSSI
jgi:hypothetical protein